jgi:antirestriction protein
MSREDSPQIYVGTYAKYNNGSIAGKWLDLEDYKDKDEFLAARAELHKDEEDPEFMYQDYQNFPESYYSESGIDESLWEWLALDEDDRIILEIYRDNSRPEADISEARDAFAGSFDSLEDYVINFWEDCGDFKQSDNWWHPSNYVDWERMGKDLETSGDIFTGERDGKIYVFNNC